jgi:charged multivesicular body protein 7
MDLVYSKEKFFNEFGTVLHAETELSDADFDVLLLYLSRDINAIAYDGKVVYHHINRPLRRIVADIIPSRRSNSGPAMIIHLSHSKIPQSRR